MSSRLIYIWICLFLTLSGYGQDYVVRTYFDNDSSKLKELVTLNGADSTLQGTYESYYQNGSFFATGYYENGLPDSLWTYYYETGKIKAQGFFNKGRQQGRWSYFYENGNKKAEGMIESGIRNGFWTNFFENGAAKSEGSYWDGKKSGLWSYFYEDGSIKAQAYYEDGTGMYKEFYPSGALKVEGKNKNEKSFGEWKYYWETGELQAIGLYEDGLRDGDWDFYHQNGELSAVGTYEKGLRTGLWKYFHENGRLSSEGVLNADEKDGVWTLYYNSGEIQGIGTYENDNGNFREYYQSGTLKAEGTIRNGEKNGNWIYYDENGVKEGEAVFENGDGSYTGFYANGVVKMKGQLRDNKRVGTWSLYDESGALVGTYKPIYEEEEPFFKTEKKDINPESRRPTDIPEYKFKNRSNRFFDSRINEFRAVIVSTNPIGFLRSELPISVEYYMQERLGYEIEYRLIRQPFFRDADINEGFRRGNGLALKQKFYSKDGRYGMVYFGHELRFQQIDHSILVLNGTGPFATDQVTLSETAAGYGVVFGWRWMKSAGDAGVTSDLFIGANIGYRSINKNYSDSSLDENFRDVNQSNLYLPFNIGINIGWAGPRQKNKGNE
jgi:antitoxin component YwqK of YwqJK toxin-antitoxin module